MAKIDVAEKAGEIFGFSDWNMGIGTVGNLVFWFFLSIIFVAVFGFVLYLWLAKKKYKHKIIVLGMMGNTAIEKWHDTAKIVPVGRAGDKLFYLRKHKRFLPNPTIQIGANKWLYWEREDGELINIGYENVDMTMKEMGVKFVDTDMRMQRLGIEKNLAYRLQKQSFWEKYGDKVVNLIFYIFITLMVIVLFVQWRKTAEAIAGAVDVASDVLARAERAQEVSPYVPSEKEGSGVIPALIFIGFTQFKIWKFKRKN